MKAQEIRELKKDDIQTEITKLEKELQGMQMGNSIGVIENPVQIRKMRRTVARLKTVLRERELEIR